MPRAKGSPQLGGSWVVDDGDFSNDDSSHKGVKLQHGPRQPPQQLTESPETSRRLLSRITSRTGPEPELIMPSIHESSMDGPWYTGQQSRLRRSPRKRARKFTPEEKPIKSEYSSTPVKGEIEREGGRLNKQPSQRTEPAVEFLQAIFKWCFDVLGRSMAALKTPISYILAIYLLLGLLNVLSNILTTSVYSALSPICRIPGTSYLDLPMCHHGILSQQPPNSSGELPLIEFDQLINVQTQFESILEESAGGVSLPLDMKRSETSLRDLRTIIRYSSLPSKNELVFEFNGFIETASIASSDLQKFNSHVGRAVDNILATARWTKRVLDGVAMEHESRGLVVGFFSDILLAPFQPLRLTEATIMQQYTEHTRLVESEINRLIDEAQVLLGVLHNLDDRLDVIHGVAIRDNLHAQGSREEVMSQLWTMLGGNRKTLGKFESQLKLLNQVNTYRQTAIAHVAGTMLKLQAMGAELAELRESVGTVGLLGDRAYVPLSVHIESIELGVGRLEQRRNWARGVENEEMRRALAKDAERDKRRVIASN
ncbi:MAG: hypothetical protein Q9216_004006 [Gyalolechia sp. 2 TL-2023]